MFVFVSDVDCFGPFCIDLYTGEITLESNIVSS